MPKHTDIITAKMFSISCSEDKMERNVFRETEAHTKIMYIVEVSKFFGLDRDIF